MKSLYSAWNDIFLHTALYYSVCLIFSIILIQMTTYRGQLNTFGRINWTDLQATRIVWLHHFV